MPTADTPLVTSSIRRAVIETLLCAVTLIVFSSGLIQFNKWLLVEERFNYAVPLTLIHMGMCSTLSLALYFVAPALFPAIAEKRVSLDTNFWLNALPITVVFALGLVLGNLAYSHLSVTFLQMIKESNLIWIYMLSLAVGLQVFALTDVKIIGLALVGMALSVHGEIAFEMTGFIIQFSALMCESTRVVLQGKMLSNHGTRLDPLSYVMLISPMCFVFLALFLFMTCFLPDDVLGRGLHMPPWEDVKTWSPILLANALIAFGLNVSIAVMIKRTSPTSYIFTQVVKDLVVVAMSVILLRESCTLQQKFGFALQTSMVLVWGLKNTFPEAFAEGIIPGFLALTHGASDDKWKSAATMTLNDTPQTTTSRDRDA
jgi:hypothetical protein